ncbi:hypothetical protein ABW21_db0206199 [Orbilia brochopaga]|nr:hypothetical protein ABW21_db0206199 [Drechslerella brochopaga]
MRRDATNRHSNLAFLVRDADSLHRDVRLHDMTRPLLPHILVVFDRFWRRACRTEAKNCLGLGLLGAQMSKPYAPVGEEDDYCNGDNENSSDGGPDCPADILLRRWCRRRRGDVVPKSGYAGSSTGERLFATVGDDIKRRMSRFGTVVGLSWRSSVSSGTGRHCDGKNRRPHHLLKAAEPKALREAKRGRKGPVKR